MEVIGLNQLHIAIPLREVYCLLFTYYNQPVEWKPPWISLVYHTSCYFACCTSMWISTWIRLFWWPTITISELCDLLYKKFVRNAVGQCMYIRFVENHLVLLLKVVMPSMLFSLSQYASLLLHTSQRCYRQFWKPPWSSSLCSAISWTIHASVLNVQSSRTIAMPMELTCVHLMTGYEFAMELSLFPHMLIFSDRGLMCDIYEVQPNCWFSIDFIILARVKSMLQWLTPALNITLVAWDAGGIQLNHGICMMVTLYIFREWTDTLDFDGQVLLLCVSRVRKLPRVNQIDAKMTVHWAGYIKNHIFLFWSCIFPWLHLAGALNQISDNPVQGEFLLQLYVIMPHTHQQEAGDKYYSCLQYAQSHHIVIKRVFSTCASSRTIAFNIFLSEVPMLKSATTKIAIQICSPHGVIFQCSYTRDLLLIGTASIGQLLSIVGPLLYSGVRLPLVSSVLLAWCDNELEHDRIILSSSHTTISMGLQLHLMVFGVTEFHANEADRSYFLGRWEAIYTEWFASTFVLPTVPVIHFQASPRQNSKMMEVMYKTLTSSSMLALQFYNLMVEDP